MKWHFINTGERSGKFNMSFDIHLAKNCKQDKAFLRFYRWKPNCISLGANQNISTLDVEKASADNIDVIFRPTGGRAILHSEELTYSVVLPINRIDSVKEIYREINLALAVGLKKFNPALNDVELETAQPNFSSFYKEDKSIACFAAPAKSELKFAGKKLAGSAQRRFDNTILQHGSILCGGFHKNIVKYLTVPAESMNEIKFVLENSTIDLKNILHEEISYDHLSECLLEGFKEHYNSGFELTQAEEIASLFMEKELHAEDA
jgi:lipoyl(octanoyl) transferase